MPLFEFRCEKCHAVTEVLCQGAGSENRAVNCAECGSLAMYKVISKVSFKVAKAQSGTIVVHDDDAAGTGRPPHEVGGPVTLAP